MASADELKEQLYILTAELNKVPFIEEGKNVVSKFGPRWGKNHDGYDYNFTTGEVISSIRPGTVESAGWDGGYGKSVVVDHGDGHKTRYAHLSEISVGVGQEIGKKQQVGLAGNTGNSRGPHLHFEVLKNGKAIEPGQYLYDSAPIRLYPQEAQRLIDALNNEIETALALENDVDSANAQTMSQSTENEINVRASAAKADAAAKLAALHEKNKDQATGLHAGDFLFNTDKAQQFVANKQALAPVSQQQSELGSWAMYGGVAPAGVNVPSPTPSPPPPAPVSQEQSDNASWAIYGGTPPAGVNVPSPTPSAPAPLHVVRWDVGDGNSPPVPIFNRTPTPTEQAFMASQSQEPVQVHKDAAGNVTRLSRQLSEGEMQYIRDVAQASEPLKWVSTLDGKGAWNRTPQQAELDFIRGVSLAPETLAYTNKLGTQPVQSNQSNNVYNPYLDNNPLSEGFYWNL